MTDKTQSIVVAATQMFARYGFSKTTMGDVAAEAGVARQTVYNAFPGKEEILRAVVRHTAEQTYLAVMAVWGEATSVDQKLTAFHEIGPLTWFEAIRAAPDWAELMDGMHKAASEELKAMDTKWRVALTDMVNRDVPERTDVNETHEDIVDFFYSASLNAKHGVDDVDQLRRRLKTIKSATLALLRQ